MALALATLAPAACSAWASGGGSSSVNAVCSLSAARANVAAVARSLVSSRVPLQIAILVSSLCPVGGFPNVHGGLALPLPYSAQRPLDSRSYLPRFPGLDPVIPHLPGRPWLFVPLHECPYCLDTLARVQCHRRRCFPGRFLDFLRAHGVRLRLLGDCWLLAASVVFPFLIPLFVFSPLFAYLEIKHFKE